MGALRGLAVAAALSALSAPWGTGAGAAPASPALDEKPFPVEKTTILREEKVVYVVDGRVRIPRGVTITCQKDVHVRAKAGTKAVIEVEGTLEFQGVGAREVILEGVAIEPCATFKEINIDAAVFRNGGGLRCLEGKPVEGKIFIENTTFGAGCPVALVMTAGNVDLSSSSFSDSVTIRGAVSSGTKENRVRLVVRGCSGFTSGLVVDGVADVVLQFTQFGGGLTAVRNWSAPMRFDANKVNSSTLELSHSEVGKMGSVTVVKCDVYSPKIEAKCPVSKDVKDVLTFDRCWFKGESDAKVLATKVVSDAEDDPKNGARVALVKINPRPHELAGSVDR